MRRGLLLPEGETGLISAELRPRFCPRSPAPAGSFFGVARGMSMGREAAFPCERKIGTLGARGGARGATPVSLRSLDRSRPVDARFILA